ncbi:hypothetical protein KHA93_13560 [Bacillus sp. FJAT-49732]|uniref:Uncharacterized protein n=1 Tax=Lederbergia citrisecunda TaxID=2833583 RepID=A0A942YMF8_9BACI|nr:hypothetical protein [Lederbergia citrisecunda]MBS4200660.1 hypothetical protein [Lederbergia citrisecunda]
MKYLIELERILTVGGRAVNQYELVFKGELAEKNNHTPFPIIHSLQTPHEKTSKKRNTSKVSSTSNIIISTPLSAKTYIKMNVHEQVKTWQISIQVDLINWIITIEPYYKDSLPLTYEISSLILSSIGIQRGQKMLSLAYLFKAK